MRETRDRNRETHGDPHLPGQPSDRPRREKHTEIGEPSTHAKLLAPSISPSRTQGGKRLSNEASLFLKKHEQLRRLLDPRALTGTRQMPGERPRRRRPRQPTPETPLQTENVVKSVQSSRAATITIVAPRTSSSSSSSSSPYSSSSSSRPCPARGRGMGRKQHAEWSESEEEQAPLH